MRIETKIPPVPIALAIPTGPRVTAREKHPVPIKVGAETRAILPSSGVLISPKGCFPDVIHRMIPKVRSHRPIETSHPYPAMNGSRLRATSDIWTNERLENVIPQRVRNTPSPVRSSR